MKYLTPIIGLLVLALGIYLMTAWGETGICYADKHDTLTNFTTRSAKYRNCKENHQMFPWYYFRR